MTDPDHYQQQAQEEQYLMTARALRDLFNGIGDEEDLAIACNACAVRTEDVLTPDEIEEFYGEAA